MNGKILVCFALLLLMGLACFPLGLGIDILLSEVALEAVLTPEEYADEQLRNRIREVLERVRSRTALNWLLAGAAIVTVSFVGLREAQVSRQGRS